MQTTKISAIMELTSQQGDRQRTALISHLPGRLVVMQWEIESRLRGARGAGSQSRYNFKYGDISAKMRRKCGNESRRYVWEGSERMPFRFLTCRERLCYTSVLGSEGKGTIVNIE